MFFVYFDHVELVVGKAVLCKRLLGHWCYEQAEQESCGQAEGYSDILHWQACASCGWWERYWGGGRHSEIRVCQNILKYTKQYGQTSSKQVVTHRRTKAVNIVKTHVKHVKQVETHATHDKINQNQVVNIVKHKCKHRQTMWTSLKHVNIVQTHCTSHQHKW